MSVNIEKVVEVEFLPKQTVLDIQPSEIFKEVYGKAGASFSRNEWAGLLENDGSKKRLLCYAACVLPPHRVPVSPFEQVKSLIAFHTNGANSLLESALCKVTEASVTRTSGKSCAVGQAMAFSL